MSDGSLLRKHAEVHQGELQGRSICTVEEIVLACGYKH